MTSQFLSRAEDNVIIFGGAGFLGRHLVERIIDRNLASIEKKNIIIVDNMMTGNVADVHSLLRTEGTWDIRLLLHDITKPLPACLFELTSISEIYNFACPASPPVYQRDPIHTMMTSVVGTNAILELAKSYRMPIKVIHASTSEIYGDPTVTPQEESYRGNVSTVGPRACYDEGKRAAEALCYDYVRKHDIDVRVVRIFNTYGPGMDPNDGRVVTNVLKQVLTGQPVTIYGDGTQTRSFTYVDDLIDGICALAALETRPAGPVNIGNTDEFSINEFVDIVESIMQERSGEKTAIQRVNKPLPVDDPTQRKPDIQYAMSLLNWRPTIPLRSGLNRTINYLIDRLKTRKS